MTSSRRLALGSGTREDGQAALEELYRAFFVRLVRRACWRYGLSKQDARGVVHDAFLLALVKLDTEGNPRSWIYSVVDRLAANRGRKMVHRSRPIERWQPGRPDSQAADENPQDVDSWLGLDVEEGKP